MRLRSFLLAGALLALTAAPARAVTFGADLATATPNYPYTCGLAAAFQGCTVIDPMTMDMELVLPDPVQHGNQTGVVTAMHVRSAATAPAQFVVVEWSGRPDEAQPFPSGVMAVSERVTLHPGMNDFKTNLPVDLRLADNGFESWSQVALTILDGTSPIPAQSGFGLAGAGLLLDGGMPLTTTVADLTGVPHNPQIGGLPPAELLMSGDVTITTGQKGDEDVTPVDPGGDDDTVDTDDLDTTTADAAQVKVPAKARLKGRAATLALRCVGTTDCKGTVRIQSRAAGAKKGKQVTYATRTFSIAAGEAGSVKATLSKAGRKATRRHRALRAYVNTTFADGHATSARVTLRR